MARPLRHRRARADRLDLRPDAAEEGNELSAVRPVDQWRGDLRDMVKDSDRMQVGRPRGVPRSVTEHDDRLFHQPAEVEPEG